MRFLYHIKHGGQLFEEDGVDHTADGWFDHPSKAGLVPIIDPNAPTRWVPPERAKVQTTAEPVWVQIPADWADLHWKQQCALAGQIKGEPVETKPAAVEVITAELERRKA